MAGSYPRLAIVTGADSGMGKATAERLASNGFDLGITFHTDEAGADDTRQAVEQRGQRELAVVRPSGVVVLGATAGKAIFGPSFRVGDSCGGLTGWPDEGPFAGKAEPEWVLPTTHPSAVLRSRERDEAMAAFVADLKVAAEAIQQRPAG